MDRAQHCTGPPDGMMEGGGRGTSIEGRINVLAIPAVLVVCADARFVDDLYYTAAPDQDQSWTGPG